MDRAEQYAELDAERAERWLGYGKWEREYFPKLLGLHAEVVKACMAADVMMGHDPDCMRWIRKFRELPTVGADGEMGRGRREGGSRKRRE